MTTINETQIYIFLATAAAIGTHALTHTFTHTLTLVLILNLVCVLVCCLINADTHTLTFFCVNLSDLISREGLQVVGTVRND